MKQHNEIVVEYLWNAFQIKVELDECVWEGVLLYHEEIDNNLISEEEIKKYLPNPVLFHIASYEDKKENEWLFALASDSDNVHPLYYAVCFLNGEKFTNWIHCL